MIIYNTSRQTVSLLTYQKKNKKKRNNQYQRFRWKKI